MIRFSVILLCCVVSASQVLAGSPKIEFDKLSVDFGTIVDGSKDKLYASFKVKNTGDALLTITNVRPSCGCTVVKFDSLVQPGKSSTIEATVNITNYHSGSISKPVTVTSNAVNTPVQQLVVNATILPILDASEQFVTLDASAQKTGHVVYLSTTKKDLKVSSVEFKQSIRPGDEWNKAVPVGITFTFSPTDSVRPDKYSVYKLSIFPPQAQQQLAGTIVIRTNHPDKAELVLQAIINK
jgi:hypothetical protein